MNIIASSARKTVKPSTPTEDLRELEHRGLVVMQGSTEPEPSTSVAARIFCSKTSFTTKPLILLAIVTLNLRRIAFHGNDL